MATETYAYVDFVCYTEGPEDPKLIEELKGSAPMYGMSDGLQDWYYEKVQDALDKVSAVGISFDEHIDGTKTFEEPKPQGNEIVRWTLQMPCEIEIDNVDEFDISKITAEGIKIEGPGMTFIEWGEYEEIDIDGIVSLPV